jgi:hypothetical protein
MNLGRTFYVAIGGKKGTKETERKAETGKSKQKKRENKERFSDLWIA